MKGRFLILYAAAAMAMPAAPLDLTGTWQPKYWTLTIQLRQDGDRVWGFGGAKDFWFRGYWQGNKLLLVANNFAANRKGYCRSRGSFTISGTTVSSVASVWLQPDAKPLRGPWTRLSPAAESVEYPYDVELNHCGNLQTYELAFATASDQLLGGDWPILAATSELMKKNPALRIEIGGHTDSTGDAKRNEDLSQRRAASVKKVLAEKYGADAARIASKGYGQAQPVADNATEEGRALNRRVEIVLVK